MIELYTWVTGNCHKIHIALEELELPYEIRPINIFKGEQFTPEFLAINPNNKVPAIVDLDGPDGGPFGSLNRERYCFTSPKRRAA